MRPDPNGPADTRDMGIVHSALRRDLQRARLALTEDPNPGRAKAIGAHLVWCMDWLHHHHTNEDEHYWPETIARNPAAAEVLGRMQADHEGLHQPLDELTAAARVLAQTGTNSAAVLAALAAVHGPLTAHLRREELEAVPLIGQSWGYADHEEFSKIFIEGKPKSQLAKEGMWMIDNATPEVRSIILGRVPALMAFVLLRVFGGRYERLKQTLWGGTTAYALAPITVEGALA